MTLEQLRIFVAVAERQHVTAAARALNLTQSAVSNALAALEERHGIHLFDRVGRGILLNENGRLFMGEAKAVLARAGIAETALADLGGLRRGRLAVFASQTIAGYWLPERLVQFHECHPGVELDVQVGNTREVARAVLDGTAELGFVEGELDHPLLEQQEVGQDRLVILVHPSHAWADGKALRDRDLPLVSWVMREQGSGTRSSLEAALAAAGCDPSALSV
ncbi:MAG: LysR family transcriptional regulator, partial [Janthinobacterium lividum]